MAQKTATFGAGCYWGVEAAFRRVDGVTATRVGFAGGTEVVEVTYDDEQLPYERLLATFWAEHDPTQRSGSLYRSVIFVHDAEQRAAAEASREQVQARLSRPVETQIEDSLPFTEADESDQQYLEKHGLASCTPRLAGTAVS